MTGEPLGENIDDTNITAAVKAKLVGERAVNLTRIDVDTVRGIVHLGGIVDTDVERARAEQIARQVGGARTWSIIFSYASVSDPFLFRLGVAPSDNAVTVPDITSRRSRCRRFL